MKIGEVAKRTGLSVHTLRYYERIGLIPAAAKDAAGQRAYDASIFPWIEFLGRLKQTGMPIQGMLRYAALRAAGPDTAPARRGILIAQRAQALAQIAQLQACVRVLDGKIEGYSHAMERTGHDTGRHARTAQPEQHAHAKPRENPHAKAHSREREPERKPA